MTDSSLQAKASATNGTPAGEQSGVEYWGAHIPHWGDTRFRSLNAHDLIWVKSFPPNRCYAACFVKLIVDGNNDRIYPPDNRGMASVLEGMHSQTYDALSDIVLDRVLNKISVDDMLKNYGATRNDNGLSVSRDNLTAPTSTDS